MQCPADLLSHSPTIFVQTQFSEVSENLLPGEAEAEICAGQGINDVGARRCEPLESSMWLFNR